MTEDEKTRVKAVQDYVSAMKELIESDDEPSDELIDRLDAAWLKMSAEGRTAINLLSVQHTPKRG